MREGDENKGKREREKQNGPNRRVSTIGFSLFVPRTGSVGTPCHVFSGSRDCEGHLESPPAWDRHEAGDLGHYFERNKKGNAYY